MARIPRQFLVPKGTKGRACPKCGRAVYRVVTVPRGLLALDCDAAGQRRPSASADGAGIPHVGVCAALAARGDKGEPVDP